MKNDVNKFVDVNVYINNDNIYKEKKKKFNFIQGLRYIFCIFILLWHTMDMSNIGILNKLLINRISLIGVDFFLITSGYVSVIIYSKKIHILTVYDYLMYLSQRFARIVPIWYFSLFCGLIIYSFDKNCSSFGCWAENRIPILEYMTFTVSWFPWNSAHHRQFGALYDSYPNPPAWTVSALALFWLLFPLLYKGISKINNSKIVFGLLLFFGFLGMAPYHIFHRHYYPEVTHSHLRWLYYFPIARLPNFLCGICIGHLYLTNKDTKMRGLGLISDITLIGVIIWIILAPELYCTTVIVNLSEFGYWCAASTIPISIWILTTSLGCGEDHQINWTDRILYKRSFSDRIFSYPLLVIGGESSTGVYLLHYSMAALAALWGQGQKIDYWGQWQILTAQSLLPLIAFCWTFVIIFDHFITKPWVNFINKSIEITEKLPLITKIT
eukprot:GHVL01030758.1.p1 GENE.GHVL01030758.1~~GHVL01030758.1.p1  ORF type:complete len:440 (+),score=48.51 GHVL01030758.1:48-1367(+)